MRTRAGTLLAARAAKGLNRARLSLRPLAPGLYTLTLTPKDAAGNVGASKAVAFQVARPAKRATKKARRPAQEDLITSAPSGSRRRAGSSRR